mmetsp:Transcript_8836/g.32843  ORF Transcript_8836/g.32843 Transcript_8836/m.32843 type:complete len:218 (+) Transcript_8836:612-1265(+)
MTSTRRSRLHRPLLYCLPVLASFAISFHVIDSGFIVARHLSVSTSIFNALSIFHLRARRYLHKHESSTKARSSGVDNNAGSSLAHRSSFKRNAFIASPSFLVSKISRPLFERSTRAGAWLGTSFITSFLLIFCLLIAEPKTASIKSLLSRLFNQRMMAKKMCTINTTMNGATATNAHSASSSIANALYLEFRAIQPGRFLRNCLISSRLSNVFLNNA